MLGLLSAIATETIIGIVAIIVIVISVGIIIATAVRNYLLHKKLVLENGGDESFINNDEVQEIDENAQESLQDEDNNSKITAQDQEEAEELDGVKAEFFDEEVEGEEVQEITFDKQSIGFSENQTQIVVDDIVTAQIQDGQVNDTDLQVK